MKKRIIFIVSILVILFSTSVSAALPQNAIIIGNKAYDLNYMVNNNTALYEVLSNGSAGDIYYVASKDSIKSLFGNNRVYTEAEFAERINPNPEPGKGDKGIKVISYYDKDGKRTDYTLGEGSFSDKGSSINISIDTVSNISAYYNIIKFGVETINNKNTDLTPYYFKVENENTLPKEIGNPKVTGEDANYRLTFVTQQKSFSVVILSKDMTILGKTDPIKVEDIKDKTSYAVKITWNQGKKDENIGSASGLGNINNGGLVAIDSNNEWTYYSNPADGGGLYKTNGFQNTKISEDNAKFINVSGDFIYYSNYSDGQKIYKIKTDGTGRRIVCGEQTSNIVVYGEYIYYRNHLGRSNGNIKRIPKDSTKSGGSDVTKEEVTFFTIGENNIYYTSTTNGNKIYSVNLDGTYRTLVADVSAKFVTYVPNNNIGTGKRIYFSDDKGRLKYVPISDRTVQEVVFYNKPNAIISSMNITDNGKTIYFVDSSDGNKVYSADISGSSSGGTIYVEKYNNDASNYVNVVNGSVYYTKYNSLYIAEGYTIIPGKDIYSPPEYIYNSKPITKPKMDLKIISYDKVVSPTKNVTGLEFDDIQQYLPDKVTAIMSDNSVRELLINWNLNVVAGKGGALNYTATIVGYGQKVSLKMSLLSDQLDASKITVINNPGRMDDRISIREGLNEGDIVRVYLDKNKTQFLGQGTAVRYSYSSPFTVDITLTGARVIPDGEKTIYLTRTSSNSAESDVTEKTVGELENKLGNITPKITVKNYVHVEGDSSSYNMSDIVTVEIDNIGFGHNINFYVKDKYGDRSEIISRTLLGYPETPEMTKFKAEAYLKQEFLKKSGDGVLYYTISNYYNQSKELSKTIPPEIVLPLGVGCNVDDATGDLNINITNINKSSSYKYYYNLDSNIDIDTFEYGTIVANSTTEPINGWIELDKDNLKILGSTGKKIHIVEAFISNGKYKAYKVGEIVLP